MRLVSADGALLEEILDATYPVWQEGLSRDGYGRWNAAQRRTAWGREHLERYALLDDRGEWVASAKRYWWPVRLHGRDTTMCGIGAVFTRPEWRGRGYASALIERLVDEARGQGAAVAGLFSEIGEPFYERLGFHTVPMDEVSVTVNLKGGAPAMLVRAGEERDLPALAAMHDTRAAGVPFSVRRDTSLMQYALAKKRLLAGLGSPGARQIEFFVVEEATVAVAYAVVMVTAGGWTLEEAGDRDPQGARLGALFQVLLAREPSLGVPRIRAWWPQAFPVPPQVQLTERVPAADLFMLRSLGDARLPSRPDDLFVWRSDYF